MKMNELKIKNIAEASNFTPPKPTSSGINPTTGQSTSAKPAAPATPAATPATSANQAQVRAVDNSIAASANPTMGASTASPAATAPAQQGYQSKNKAFADKVNTAAAQSNLADMNKIQPGQKIKMPDGSDHVVQKGETLSGIIAGKKAAPAIARPTPAAPAPVTQNTNNGSSMTGNIGNATNDPVAPATQAATSPVLGTPENPYPQGAPVTSPVSGETWRTSDGSALRTRSDAEIGDTNPRTGVVTPGSYDARMANGAANMQRLQNFGQGVSNFLGLGKKEAPAPAQPATQFENRESNMELNQLRKFSGLPELTESDVTVHKGNYGNSYGKEDVRDQYGHKIGKVDKGSEAKKDAPKRGRGRPTKGDKDEHGNDTKFDTSGLQGMLGSKAKGEVGKKSVKHSLKDWIEVVSDNMINEGEGDFETALSKLGGNWSHWHKIDSNDPNVDEYNFDDGEGGYYAQGNIEHNLETGQVTVDYSDQYDNDVKGTFDSFGEAMRALRGGGGNHGGKAPNFDKLGHRELHTSNDLRKTDRTGRKGTLAGGPTNRLKQSIQHNKGNLGPKGVLPEQGMFEGEKQMSRAAKGNEKYGKDGMKALAKAGRDGASEKKLDTIRNEYDKYDKIEENRDAYQRDHDSSVSGMGTDHEFRNRERNAGLEDEKNNYAVEVNGKQWKVFADKRQAENIAKSLTAKGKKASVHITGANVSEAKDLPGKQEKLDVAEPKGKLTKADFEALRKKKKVSEARVMEESEYTYEKVGKTLAQENPTLASDSDEFANAVYHEMIQMGMTPRSAHHKLNYDEDFLGEVVTAYHHYLGHGAVDEGQHTQHYMDANKPSPVRQHAELEKQPKQHTPWSVDPINAATDRAGSFIRNLTTSKKAFEGKDMKDMQVETWKSTLNELINENITISTTIDDQGHDSVNVSATEGNAHEIIELLRNAGLGGMGGGKQEHGQKVNNYGLPMSNGEHSGPEAQLIAVGDPHEHDSMGGGDDMMSLIQKMTGIENSGEHGSQDYEEEEGHTEHNHEEGECEECGEGPCECDDEAQEVDEAEMDEGNEFSGELAKAKAQHKDHFNVDGKEYPVKEDEMEEGNMFTGNLAKARAQGKEEADLDGDGDMEKVQEGHDTCNECGGMMYEGHSCGSEQLEEFANDADDTADQDLEFMTRTLSGGGGMGEKRSQATAPIVKIVTAEGTLMKDSTDLLSDFRKLSGI